MKLTEAEHRVLVDYIETGHLATTAARLEIAESTAKNLLLSARRRNKLRGTVQLAYALGAGELDA